MGFMSLSMATRAVDQCLKDFPPPTHSPLGLMISKVRGHEHHL